MKMNIKPAFRYQFDVFFKGSAITFLVIMAAIAALMVTSIYISADTTTISFTGYGITAVIFLFIMGIVNIRSDLRLCLQYGVSRRTSFVSEILAVLSVSAILAAAGELLTGIAQAFSAGNSQFLIADLYQLIYVGPDAVSLSFGQHILSMLLNTSLTFCACLFGMFFSLMFWRLNKVWTVVAAISIPVLINVVPILLSRLGINLILLINWIGASPFNFVLFFLLLAALFGAVNWLLLRRANIKEAK
ncbi:MAG TPA: hypothetical protein P5185_00430 [Oscillospiraceae bacterium]|nr:hypothetical protein [Oscillospiraceae bacterium]